MKAKAYKGPDLFTTNKTEWLAKARSVAKDLLKQYDWITSEEVTALCPLPRYLSRNTIGHIFMNQSEFQMVGTTPAQRPSSNGRRICKWALKNPQRVEKWAPTIEADEGR